MNDPAPHSSLSSVALSAACCHEMERYRKREQSDPAFCLELFRRALHEQQEEAWDLLLNACIAEYARAQFYGHPSWRRAHRYQHADYYLVEAFARLWQSSSGHRLQLESLGGILSLLQRCLHSAILNELRLWSPPETRQKRRDPRAQIEPGSVEGQGWPSYSVPPQEPTSGNNPEDVALSKERIQEVWASATTDTERRLILLRWQEGYTPKEMAANWPGEFGSASEISACLRNVLARYYRRKRKQDDNA